MYTRLIHHFHLRCFAWHLNIYMVYLIFSLFFLTQNCTNSHSLDREKKKHFSNLWTYTLMNNKLNLHLFLSFLIPKYLLDINSFTPKNYKMSNFFFQDKIHQVKFIHILITWNYLVMILIWTCESEMEEGFDQKFWLILWGWNLSNKYTHIHYKFRVRCASL